MDAVNKFWFVIRNREEVSSYVFSLEENESFEEVFKIHQSMSRYKFAYKYNGYVLGLEDTPSMVRAINSRNVGELKKQNVYKETTSKIFNLIDAVAIGSNYRVLKLRGVNSNSVIVKCEMTVKFRDLIPVYESYEGKLGDAPAVTDGAIIRDLDIKLGDLPIKDGGSLIFDKDGDSYIIRHRDPIDENHVCWKLARVNGSVSEPYTQKVQTDTQKVQTDTQKVQTDTKKVQTDTQKVQTDTKKVQTDTQKVQTDTQKVQTDTKRVQTDTQKVEPDTQKAQEEIRKVQTELAPTVPPKRKRGRPRKFPLKEDSDSTKTWQVIDVSESEGQSEDSYDDSKDDEDYITSRKKKEKKTHKLTTFVPKKRETKVGDDGITWYLCRFKDPKGHGMCTAKFKRMADCKRHEKTTHNYSSKYRCYKCDEEGEEFEGTTYLARIRDHLEETHGIKDSQSIAKAHRYATDLY